MSFADEVFSELSRHGRSATYRRITQSAGAPSPNSKQNPPDVTGSLTVQATVNAGQSSIVATAPSLRGRFAAGDQFTVAGNATVYTISADAIAANNQATLSFTPALATQAVSSTALTFVFDADTAIRVAPRRLSPRDLTTSDIQNGMRMLVIAAKSLLSPPKDGDRILLDGNWLTIVGPPSTAYDGEEAAVYRVIVRG